MCPKIWIFETYGLLMCLGIFLAFVVFELFFRKHLKVPGGKVYYLEMSLFIAVIAGLVGSYLFQNIYNFIENPSTYKWEWSLTFYGGIIGGVAGFFIMWFAYGKKHYKEGLNRLLCVAPGCITLAHGIGRIGCFCAGCCYGIETDAWYGITFPGMTHKVIPTNLMEAIFVLLLAILLIYLAFKKHSNLTFSIYMISYGIWRFLIEFIRGDHRGSFIPGITPSQFWSILLIVFGIVWFVLIKITKQKNKF